jgi:hypothetical protein
MPPGVTTHFALTHLYVVEGVQICAHSFLETPPLWATHWSLTHANVSPAGLGLGGGVGAGGAGGDGVGEAGVGLAGVGTLGVGLRGVGACGIGVGGGGRGGARVQAGINGVYNPVVANHVCTRHSGTVHLYHLSGGGRHPSDVAGSALQSLEILLRLEGWWLGCIQKQQTRLG